MSSALLCCVASGAGRQLRCPALARIVSMDEVRGRVAEPLREVRERLREDSSAEGREYNMICTM